jgi:fucose permease
VYRASIALSYAAFILVGVDAAVGGVLLVSQIADYGVSRSQIGVMFFTGSVGFFLASTFAGQLVHRLGVRLALTLGSGVFIAAALYMGTRPPFVMFVAVNLLIGFGTGVLESVLNAYLALLPEATTRLNRLHAFFGVGALLGPVLATWIIGFTSWTVVFLVLAGVCVPLTVGFMVAYPQQHATAGETGGRGLMRPVLKQRAILLGAVLLAVYVGLELGMGNWSFSYLVQERGRPDVIAGYAVSGYWLGLTIGRFLISPIADRFGVTQPGMMYGCLVGITVSAVFVWLVPLAAASAIGLIVLGFFLGPIFPTTMAIVPQLTPPRYVPAAVGVINAGSVLGGSALPWLAGALAQGAGMWTLLPFAVTLAALLLVVWWRMARWMPRATGATPAEQPIRSGSPG